MIQTLFIQLTSHVVWYHIFKSFSMVRKITDADSSGKQCAGIYPAQLVGGQWPPSPQCIGAAPPDAQAAVGVCWYIPAGQDAPGGAAPGGRMAAVRQYRHRPLAGGE